MKKIIIAKTIIFFLFQISTAQDQQIISDTISLDGVTLEAIKIPLKEKKALYPISKFNFKNYQFLTPQINISEFLESVPGLFILNNNNYAQDPRISIRGFGSRANFGVRGIKIFVDGIPETSPDGQSQTDNINLAIIEGVEVFRGNNSSLFGSSSGGAISITTLEDFKKDFFRFGYSLGSFDTSKSQATIGLVNNKQKLVFFISNTKSNGYRAHTEYESFNLNFKYIVNINANNKLQLIGNFLNSPRANDPGGLNIEEVKTDRSQGRFRNIQYDAGEKVKQYKVGLNLSSIIRKLKLTNSIYFNQRLFDGKLPFGSGGIVDLNRSFWGYKLNVNFDGLLNYDLGLAYNSQKDDRQRFINDEGIKTDQVMGQYENYENISLYFFGSKSIQRFNLSVGARLENNIISVEGYFNPVEKKIKKINSFNPSINILYELNKIDLFGNFSSGYETPTLNSFYALVKNEYLKETVNYTIKRNGLVKEMSGPNPFPALIDNVTLRSSAFNAGLKSGDVIQEINGFKIYKFSQLQYLVASIENYPINLKVWRGGEILDFLVTPKLVDYPKQGGGFDKRKLIGITAGSLFEFERTRINFFEATWLSIQQIYGIITGSLDGIKNIIIAG